MIFAYVPTLNNQKTIESTVKSVLNQTKKPDYVCVIDSGSTDKTEEIVKSLGVDFYRPSDFGMDFLGLGRARNYATKMAHERGLEYVLAVDSDVVVENEWLTQTYEFMINNKNYGGVGGRLVEANRALLGDRFRAEIICGDLISLLKDKRPGESEWLSGSQNLYRVSHLLECGNFDESLKANYEDIDIALKLKKFGRQMYYIPTAIAYHYQQDSVISVIDRLWRYEFMRHQRNGAFENLENYEAKFDHLRYIIKHIASTSYKRARAYLVYPGFLMGYLFMLYDAVKFVEFGRRDLAIGILKAFYDSLEYTPKKSSYLKDGLLIDCKYKLDELNVLISADELSGGARNEAVYEWFKSLSRVDWLDKNFPAISQNWLDQTEKPIQIKVIESSRERMVYEEENLELIYGDFKVLLVNPTWRVDDRYGVRAGSRWPHTNKKDRMLPIPGYVPFPFFLAQTLSLLRENKIPSHFIDAIAEGYNDDECWVEAFGYDPQLIVIETSTPSFYVDINWVKTFKQKIPNAKVCMVGPHIAFEKSATLSDNKEVDFAVYGEYEIAVLELSKALKNGSKLSNIKGLIYRENGEVKENGRTDAVDFASMPIPTRITLPYYNYNDRPIKELKYPSLQILLSRGCPYKCTFCLWPQVMFNKNYQLANLDKAVLQIREGIDKYGIRSFYVDDDTFNINKKHLMDFTRKLKENNINLPWMAMARGDTIVDRETFTALKESNLIAIKFGVESVDDVVLKEMDKGLDVKKCEESIGLCRELGIEVHLTFSIGYLNDTIERIRKTFLWSLDMNPSSIQVSLVTPFPATKMYEDVVRAGFRPEEDYTRYDGARFTVVSSHIEQSVLQDIHQAWYRLFGAYKRGKQPNERDIKTMFYGAGYEQDEFCEKSEDYLKFKKRVTGQKLAAQAQLLKTESL